MTYPSTNDAAGPSGIGLLSPGTCLPAIIRWGAIALSFALVAVIALTPWLYNTLHVSDTTWMAQVGRWIQEGAVPGVDFDHFYGGMHEWFIARGLDLSGGTIKALDYAQVLEFAVVALALQLAAWRRIDPTITALLTLLCAIVLLTRVPFEEYRLLTRLDAAHSFAYNRLGTAFTILCATVLMGRSETRAAELMGGAVAGVAVIAAILCKFSFFPVAIVLPLGLAMMARWPTLITTLIAMTAFFLLMDPTGGRTFGTLSYTMASSGTSATEPWFVRKAFRLVFTQQMQVMMALTLMVLLLLRDRSRETLVVLAVGTLLMIAFWGTSVTMGFAGLVGQQSTPLLVTLALLLIPRFGRLKLAVVAWPLVAVLYTALVLPHGLNVAGSTASAFLKSNRIPVHSGPLAGYLVNGAWLHYRTDTGDAADPTAQVTLERTARRFAAGEHDAGIDFVMLMDAVRLVQDIPDLSEIGLASNTRMGLGFATGTQRVEGYPAWIRPTSVELAEGGTPLRHVSLLLMTVTDTHVSDLVRGHMGTDFTLCRQSPLWDLYVRETEQGRFCPDATG